MTNKANFYTVLGVKRDDTDKDIKSSYRKLASKHHPDKGGNEEQFKKIQEAYDTLGDKKKRALYDNGNFNFNSGRADSAFRDTMRGGKFNQGSNAYTSEDLRDMFSTRSERRTMPTFQISLVDAYNGVHKVTKYGSVTIPKGIRSGSRMYVGHDKTMIEFMIGHHPVFKRANDDLLITVNLNVLDVMTGGRIRFEHLDGRTYEIKIQLGIQHGQVMKVGGKGMPNPETDQYGDLLIECNIVIPSLTQTEKEAIIAIHKPGTTEV